MPSCATFLFSTQTIWRCSYTKRWDQFPLWKWHTIHCANSDPTSTMHSQIQLSLCHTEIPLSHFVGQLVFIDSWQLVFTDEEELDNNVSSTDSELSLSDSHFTSSDDDDNEEIEEGEESQCLFSTTAGNEELQTEFGTENIGNIIHIFPIVSSDIVADCSTKGDDNDFESYQFITITRTSSEEELQMIFGNEDEQQKQNEDTTDEDIISTKHQNPMPTVPTFFPPQITALETLSSQYFQCNITTDYSLNSGNSVAVSRTSSEEELRMMLDIEDEDTDHNKLSSQTSRTLYLGCLHFFHLKCLSTVNVPPHFNQRKLTLFAVANLPHTWQSSIHSSVQG